MNNREELQDLVDELNSKCHNSANGNCDCFYNRERDKSKYLKWDIDDLLEGRNTCSDWLQCDHCYDTLREHILDYGLIYNPSKWYDDEHQCATRLFRDQCKYLSKMEVFNQVVEDDKICEKCKIQAYRVIKKDMKKMEKKVIKMKNAMKLCKQTIKNNNSNSNFSQLSDTDSYSESSSDSL